MAAEVKTAFRRPIRRTARSRERAALVTPARAPTSAWMGRLRRPNIPYQVTVGSHSKSHVRVLQRQRSLTTGNVHQRHPPPRAACHRVSGDISRQLRSKLTSTFRISGAKERPSPHIVAVMASTQSQSVLSLIFLFVWMTEGTSLSLSGELSAPGRPLRRRPMAKAYGSSPAS
jgi:hypothetical protein